jgi:hypothetical protein
VVLLAYITQVEAPVAIDILPAILSVVRAAINSTLVDSKRLYVPKLARYVRRYKPVALRLVSFG